MGTITKTVQQRMVRFRQTEMKLNEMTHPGWEDAADYISKKHFRPGGMAASEWTRSVRAIRDTPVAEYCASGFTKTRRIAYRYPITVSQFLLALPFSSIKQTLWHCAQL
jgi:hypothetical protein